MAEEKKEYMFEIQRGGDMEYSIKIIHPDGNYIQSKFMDITLLVQFIFSHATAEIKSLLKSKLPKKYEDIEKSEANEETKEYMRGYNQAIAEIKREIG